MAGTPRKRLQPRASAAPITAVAGWLLLLPLTAFGAAPASNATMPAASGPWGEARMEQLSPEQRELATRMLRFVTQMNGRFRARVGRINGAAGPLETLQRETDDSVYDVWVTRGPVVEKLGGMFVEGKKQQPGRKTPPLVWGRFYSLDYHTRTPLVGMLHATLVLQFYADGSGFAGGWLGVMNGTRNAEDMDYLTRVVDEHFAAYDRSPKLYRRLMVKGTEDTKAEFRRIPDASGVSFYGPPVFPQSVAKSYDLVEGLFTKFNDAYLDIVERRSNQPFTAEDTARFHAMQKRWLVDQLYSDPFASELVPFDVWSFANVPPLIRF